MRNLASSIVSPRPNTLGTKLTLKTVALATNQLKDAEISLKRVRRKTEDLLVDSQFMLFLLILVYSHYSWRRILKVGVDRKVNTHHYSDETVYCRTPAVSVPQFTRRKTWKYSLYIDLFARKLEILTSTSFPLLSSFTHDAAWFLPSPPRRKFSFTRVILSQQCRIFWHFYIMERER